MVERVVEKIVRERLKGELYTETTGVIPVSFYTVLSENGASAILFCFFNSIKAAEKAVAEFEEEVRKEIEEMAMLKARLRILKADREIFERNGIGVV